MKEKGEKITVLTAYDASFAKLISEIGIEVLLVGDSLGMVIQGNHHTIPVTLKDIIYHTRCVAQGNTRSFVVADLPFMTFSSIPEALTNAAKLLRAGAAMVKIEGGGWVAEIVQALTEKGIPVAAHLGLTAQSVHALGGYKVQGRKEDEAKKLILEAKNLQDAGATLMILECIPHLLAAEITSLLTIPTIGIGAGPACDGQVLVTYDMLGFSSGYPAMTFVKDFLHGESGGVRAAIERYRDAVKQQQFPTLEHSFS
jgi:3-methyl-2-oxobutanoate hydroxymethyltransferase